MQNSSDPKVRLEFTAKTTAEKTFPKGTNFLCIVNVMVRWSYEIASAEQVSDFRQVLFFFFWPNAPHLGVFDRTHVWVFNEKYCAET